MTKVQREGIERQVGPELAHYIEVTDAATRSGLNSLYRGLGEPVLDDEDRVAMFGPQIPVTEASNNVISFPVSAQPNALGEMATESAGIAPETSADAAPLGSVTPIDRFPTIEPPFADAA